MMRKYFSAALIFLIFSFFLFACVGSTPEQPGAAVIESLSGPYLGQTPPGLEPEIFAPGIISTHYSQSYIAFLNEALFCVYSAGTEKGHETYYTFEKNGHWTAPRRAPFEELQGHPNYTAGPLGRKVYFHSGRPTHPGDERQDDNIWTIEWTGSDWAEPEVLPAPANSDYGEAYPSAAADGTVYFFTWRRPETRGDDIWVSRCIDGQYQEAERLPWPINTDFIEYDPYAAPDESFLIFGSTRPCGYGNSDNYICFRKGDGSWTSPINLGRGLNSSSYDLCANGTPDGRYFFFISGRETDVDKGQIGKRSGEKPDEDSDLYWVDFAFINDLKNTVLTKQHAAKIIKKNYGENGIQSAVDTLNRLYSGQRDRTYFSPFELLSLCKHMLAEDKTEDADVFFSALHYLLPEDLSIKEGYARLCAMNGRVSKGLNIFEELESEDPNFDLSDSLSGLGYLFTLYPDKTEDALSVLRFTVDKFPEDWFAYYGLARVYRQQGDLDKAILNCRKALEISPSVGDVSQLLERLFQEKEGQKTDNQKKDSFPALKGPYFSRKPPGKDPELFMPGLISTPNVELCISFLDKGRVCVFGRDDIGVNYTWLKNGSWMEPKKMPLDSDIGEWKHNAGPDDKTLFFMSPRPTGAGDKKNDFNIFKMEWTGSGWTDQEILSSPPNSEEYQEIYPSFSSDGSAYFHGGEWRNAPDINDDIYRSRCVNGIYQEQERLGEPISTRYGEYDAFVAPDEEYLMFGSDRPGGFGRYDSYICFKKENGGWTHPINLGGKLNSTSWDNRVMVTPDGKYMFFVSGRRHDLLEDEFKNGKRTSASGFYWVNAAFIQNLKDSMLTSECAADIISSEYKEHGLKAAIGKLSELRGSREKYHVLPSELLLLCRRMIEAGEVEDSDRFYQALLDNLEEDFRILRGYGMINIRHGRLEKGLDLLHRVMSDLPVEHLVMVYTLGSELLVSKPEDALRVMQFNAREYPGHYLSPYGLARAYERLGDTERVVKYCEKALELNPDYDPALNLLRQIQKIPPSISHMDDVGRHPSGRASVSPESGFGV